MTSSTIRDASLRPGQLPVWLARTDQSDPIQLARYEPLLDSDEQRRYRAFHFARDQQLYLVAHALLRTTLSRYAPVPPAAWRFHYEPLGRPQIAEPAGYSWLRFNLSHTAGLAACAVAHGTDVGVDVEHLDRRIDCESLAPRYFSPVESAELFRLPPECRPTRFLEYWTLKEAYVKARGDGLSMPLDSFTFQTPSASRWQVEFHSAVHGDPQHWQFACRTVTPGHLAAVAIRRAELGDFDIDFQHVVPQP